MVLWIYGRTCLSGKKYWLWKKIKIKNKVCYLSWTANIFDVFMLDCTLTQFKMERNAHSDEELVQTLQTAFSSSMEIANTYLASLAALPDFPEISQQESALKN